MQASSMWLLLADDWRARRTLLREKIPQERKRRGGSAAARGKRSLARKSTAVEQAIYKSSFLPSLCL
ncbi:hypothetical protein [Priestia megaterium]|uniref:hypothetical protein n=1 Tax=Priestia megaterium TaxID=1404 RepID=UPI002877FE2B|nr:hypothetical protein [Priestia megaterium]